MEKCRERNVKQWSQKSTNLIDQAAMLEGGDVAKAAATAAEKAGIDAGAGTIGLVGF